MVSSFRAVDSMDHEFLLFERLSDFESRDLDLQVAFRAKSSDFYIILSGVWRSKTRAK